MVKKALTLFNTYNYFLGNFHLGEAFYRMLENIQLSLGMSKIFIILYDRKKKQLVIKGTPSPYRQLLDHRIELDMQENRFLSEKECRELWFSAAGSPSGAGLAEKLAELFGRELGSPDGVFVPVRGASSFVGGFVALCRSDQHNISMIVEFLNGYAVQLALAIRIYRLNKRMLSAEHDKTVMEMAGSLAHSLNQPLQTLSSYIYLLEKEMRVGSYGNSNRNVYCEKMKKALDEIQHSIKRFESARETEATEYYGREKILSI
jgi:signal transduction histidine kinase